MVLSHSRALSNNVDQYPWCHVMSLGHNELTHWGRVTHICVNKLAIIGSDNGLSPGRRQAIIWTSARILLIGPLGTNFSEILIEIYTFSVKKMHLKMLSGKWRPFCLGHNELSHDWMHAACGFHGQLLKTTFFLVICINRIAFVINHTQIWIIINDHRTFWSTNE